MRLLGKLALKFGFLVAMVLVMGSGVKRGPQLVMKALGQQGAEVSSEEADLMSTVFQSAVRLVTGQAKRDELASELSEKLYGGRAEAGDMNELGIELVKPAGASPLDETKPGAQVASPLDQLTKLTPAAVAAQAGDRIRPGMAAKTSPTQAAALPPATGSAAVYRKVWERIRPYTTELALAPVVLCGMIITQRLRGRRSKADDFVPPMVAMQAPTDSEPYDMQHAVHGLGAEEFELLVALVYQRQGYRISMPAALSGGRGGDFTLERKSERILVQSKKLSQEHRIPVERVRELHEAMTAAGLSRAYFVASCGFTWDARNFAKTRGLTLINARTLDELLLAARTAPGEDLLDTAQWIPTLLGKVKLKPPLCPTCEASMDEITISERTNWLCTQRPDCKGRRSPRKYTKAPQPASRPAAAALAA